MRRKPFNPYFDKGLRGWVVQMAQRHYWRVAAWYDLDDLIQDGYLAFAICKSRYQDRVENKAHFMALFKRVYFSIITNMANARTRDIPQVAISQIAVPGMETAALELLGGGIDGDAELAATIARATGEVKLILDAVMAGTLEIKPRSHHLKRTVQSDGRVKYVLWKRETNNEYYNRVLGTVGVDFETRVKQFIMPQSTDYQWAAFFADIFFPEGLPA